MARNLACSTKAKREALAARTIAMMAEYGATLKEREDDRSEIRLCFTYAGYAVSMDFDGALNCEGFMAHWHMDYETGTREQTYPRDFGYAIGGSMNTCHYRKATTCEDTVDRFLSSLAKGLQRLTEHMVEVQLVAREAA